MTNEDYAFAIEVDSVSKAYGHTQALSKVNLKVGFGESRALLGRNGAGKSTVIGALTGLVSPDSGEIRLRGRHEDPAEGPGSDALGCVFQKATLIPGLTAAENIYLGRYPTRFGRVDWSAMRRDASEVLEHWGAARIADQQVDTLQPLERKIVEMCRALAKGPRILLLDEPTAGLDEDSVQELFSQLAEARNRGVTLVYVSHHLEEIFKVCDGVTVIRDGRDVLTAPIEEMTVPRIVDAMVGSAGASSPQLAPSERVSARAPIVLAARDINGANLAQTVSVEVRKGECLGITGLDGAGHVGLAKTIAGDLRRTSGTVTVGEREVPGGSVRAAIDSGIGYVPEDRHDSGFVPGLSVEENATLSIIDRLAGRSRLISGRRRRTVYSGLAESWSIKASAPVQAAEELSGGNQQKVVLARALASDPEILVLINPTAGVDVTAKESIYRSLLELREQGRGVVICSTDDTDLALCDRVLVMYKGAPAGELRAGFSEHELVATIQGARSKPTTEVPA